MYMLFRRSNLLIAALAACLSAQPVNSQEAPSQWQGWYGGALLGVSWTAVDISMPPTGSSGTYSGIAGGLVGGNNFYVTDKHLVGFEADFLLHDIAGDVSLARHRVSLVGRVGRFISPDTLLFGVAGLTGGQYRAEVTATSTSTMVIDFDDEVQQVVTTTTATSSNRNKRLWGFTVGGGFETTGQLAGQEIRWGAEYRFSDFEDWRFTVGSQNFKIEPQVHDLRFRVVLPY